MNIETAEKFFKEYNGQSFHMAREEPDRYNAFREIDVARHIKEKWALELFTQYKSEIAGMTNRNNDNSKPADNPSDWSWIKFGKAIDLAESYPSLWQRLYYLISDERNKILRSERIIIAESILGRTDLIFRSALPFYCLKNNQKALAQKFLDLTHILICESAVSNFDIPRLERARLRLSKVRRRIKFPLLYLVF